MKKLSKIAVFVIVAAIIVSICTLFAGCGTSSVKYRDFSTVVDEFKEKMSLAKKSRLELSCELDIVSSAENGNPPLEIHVNGSNSMKKLNNDRLDFTNNIKVKSTSNITDDIGILVGNSLDFGGFDIRTGDEDDLDFENVNKIYVRDDTQYTLRDGELISMVSGERFDGELSKSVVTRYVNAAASLGDFFDEDCLDYFLYPTETKFVNVVSSLKSKLKSVTYRATESDDKLDAVITVVAVYTTKARYSQTDETSDRERDEFFGHFANRDFSAQIKYKLTMDTSPSLKKSKFDKLDYDLLTKDVLYMEYGSDLAEKLAAGDKTEITIKGGGDQSYTDLVYKNGEYTEQNAKAGRASIYCTAYMCDSANTSSYVTSENFASNDYSYAGNLLTINRRALNNAKYNLEEERNSGYYSDYNYSAQIRYVTVTFTYRTLVDNPEINKYGYYGSDQYRNFTHTVYLYM